MTKEQLIKEIRSANIAYSSGNPYLTDAEYDLLWRQLYHLDPSCAYLYHTGNAAHLPGSHRLHQFPIMGTQKAFSTVELMPFLNRFKDQQLRIEPKYDGCAAMLYRQNNNQLSLILEGDGVSGRDISEQLPSIDIAAIYPLLPFNSIELIIPTSKFHPSLGKNPRNTVAGWINSNQLMPANYVEAVSHNDGNLYALITPGDFSNLEMILPELYAAWSKRYPLDGLMLKPADHTVRIKASHNGSVYNWSIAWKPSIHSATSVVRSIEWNTSRSGRVIPTVLYEPIEIASTINSRATGNNATWIKESQIIPGSIIEIVKAGDIIPKIVSVTTTGRSSLPTYCPACGETLTWAGKDLICEAGDCIIQFAKRIAYFYSDKGMNLKSVGETMIADLLSQSEIASLVLTRKPWALLDPRQYELTDILEDVWGVSRYLIYRDNLDEISGRKTMIDFISALGLRGLAYKTAFKLYQFVIHGDTRKFKSVSSVGIENYAVALSRWNEMLEDGLSFNWIEPIKAAGIHYCITGTLSVDRSDMADYLRRFGWIEMNQVSKLTDYLLLGQLSHESQKLHNAKKNNIRIISEDDLTKLLMKDTNDGNEEL